MLQIRDARLDDIPAIEEMVEDFVKGHPAENQPRSADALRRAYFGDEQVRDGDIVGMGQWRLGHDMFWGWFFVEAEWLYVRPRCRGSGIVTAIVAAICGHGRRAGAQFLHGGGGEGPQKLYERVAIGMLSRECFLSGKGFQVMASLEGLPVREIVRRLPTPELSRQPAES